MITDHKNQVLRCPKCGDERYIPYAVSKNGERMSIFLQTATNEHRCRKPKIEVKQPEPITPEERWDQAVREYNRELSKSH